MKGFLKKVSKYIQDQNEKIYAPQDLYLTDLIERDLKLLKLPFMKTDVWKINHKNPNSSSIYYLADHRVSPISSLDYHSFVSAAKASMPFTTRTF